MERFTYSIPPHSRFLTGLTNLDGVAAKKIPGKNFSLLSESFVSLESSFEVAAEGSLGGK
jgi:hypothetical protein